MLNIGFGFLAVDGSEVVAHSDALTQLAEFIAIEAVAELRLANEDDLQQFVLVGFEVGQQTHLLELLLGHVLCFVDDEHDHAIGVRLFEQKPIEAIDQPDPVVSAVVEVELAQD